MVNVNIPKFKIEKILLKDIVPRNKFHNTKKICISKEPKSDCSKSLVKYFHTSFWNDAMYKAFLLVP